MRAVLAIPLAVVLTLGLAACAERRGEKPQVDLRGLDKKLSTFAFIEEGDLVSFTVGTKATRYREEAGFIPLEIAIANLGVKELTITRESFTLRDSQGMEYPCANPKALMESYDFLDLDRRLGELPGILLNRYAALVQYPSKFSPTRGVDDRYAPALVRDTVVLPRFGFLHDFIYFPRPETGVLNQRFELHLKTPELADAVFVKFAVL